MKPCHLLSTNIVCRPSMDIGPCHSATVSVILCIILVYAIGKKVTKLKV